MPEEKDSRIGAKRGKIQYDHDQREKIHSHCHKVIGDVCQQSPTLSCAEVNKPGNYSCRAAKKSQQQTTSRHKQARPGNRQYCFFPDVEVAAESNKPAKFRNERTVERDNGL